MATTCATIHIMVQGFSGFNRSGGRYDVRVRAGGWRAGGWRVEMGARNEITIPTQSEERRNNLRSAVIWPQIESWPSVPWYVVLEHGRRTITGLENASSGTGSDTADQRGGRTICTMLRKKLCRWIPACEHSSCWLRLFCILIICPSKAASFRNVCKIRATRLSLVP